MMGQPFVPVVSNVQPMPFSPKPPVHALNPTEQKQIDLWVEQRRRNFPSKNKAATDKRTIENKASELSELERKLRKKLTLILSQMSGGKDKKRPHDRKPTNLPKQPEKRQRPTDPSNSDQP